MGTRCQPAKPAKARSHVLQHRFGAVTTFWVPRHRLVLCCQSSSCACASGRTSARLPLRRMEYIRSDVIPHQPQIVFLCHIPALQSSSTPSYSQDCCKSSASGPLCMLFLTSTGISLPRKVT